MKPETNLTLSELLSHMAQEFQEFSVTDAGKLSESDLEKMKNAASTLATLTANNLASLAEAVKQHGNDGGSNRYTLNEDMTYEVIAESAAERQAAEATHSGDDAERKNGQE